MNKWLKAASTLILAIGLVLLVHDLAASGTSAQDALRDTTTPAIWIDPAMTTTQVGRIFTATIMADTGSQLVDAAQIFLGFDPVYLMVVDALGNSSTAIVSGTVFEMHLLNAVSNTAGTIDYADGQLTGAPVAGRFALATIRFKALGQSAGTSIVFSSTSPRLTKLTSGGQTILPHLSSGSATIGATGTPSPTVPPRPPSSRSLYLPVIVADYLTD